MSRLLLLDGHSLAYRAFYALPVENFSTTTGQSTNAVYGFTSMLINVLRDEVPTHVAVAFDKSSELDGTTLVETVDGIVADMHEDGTLSGFSETWYPGADVSEAA